MLSTINKSSDIHRTERRTNLHIAQNAKLEKLCESFGDDSLILTGRNPDLLAPRAQDICIRRLGVEH